MKRHQYAFPGLIFTWMCLTPTFSQPDTFPPYADPAQPLEIRVEDALSRMTLEEKVALCHAQSKFSSAGVPRLGIPELWLSDGPHGVREEIKWDAWDPAGWTNDSITAFPALTCLAATFNPDLSLAYGMAIGEEARYRNKHILLGPGVNIYRTPFNGRNFEYMGEDPYLASVMVVPYIKGVQRNGVAACVKHFALNNQEVDRNHIDVVVSNRALYEIYLPAFKAAVRQGVAWSIMGAYNKYKGQHCCHNDWLLNRILKQGWGFDGVVVSDWGGTHDTKEAALHGLDLEMGTYTDGLSANTANAYDHYYLANPFLQQVRSGDIPVSVVDDKARRILRLMFRTSLAPNRPLGRLVCEDHSRVARQVATEGMVLLKNDASLLPLSPQTGQRIAVVGENAVRSLTKGGGSSELKPKYEITPLQAIKQVFGDDKVTFSYGYASGRSLWGREEKGRYKADSLLSAALKTAEQADVILLVGGLNKNHFQDSEGGDRYAYGLPFGQEALIEALASLGKPLVVVLMSGNAVAMPWLPNATAVLQAWYLGSEAGNALVDVLTGVSNPSGKLPFSIPKRLEDNAAHAHGKLAYPGDHSQVHYLEDILVGYRWHDTKGIPALFPFGYGLSYTTFELGPVKATASSYCPDDTIRLRVTVRNTGTRDGAEVIQVYATQRKPSVPRPAKELKAFRKVYLKAGERRTVTIDVLASDLAFYCEETNDWVLESDTFTLQVGTSSLPSNNKVAVRIQ